MVYVFICPQCGEKVDITMPASEYRSTGHFCPCCSTEMVRDPQNFCKSSPRNIEGFFGTTEK